MICFLRGTCLWGRRYCFTDHNTEICNMFHLHCMLHYMVRNIFYYQRTTALSKYRHSIIINATGVSISNGTALSFSWSLLLRPPEAQITWHLQKKMLTHMSSSELLLNPQMQTSGKPIANAPSKFILIECVFQIAVLPMNIVNDQETYISRTRTILMQVRKLPLMSRCSLWPVS